MKKYFFLKRFLDGISPQQMLGEWLSTESCQRGPGGLLKVDHMSESGNFSLDLSLSPKKWPFLLFLSLLHPHPSLSLGTVLLRRRCALAVSLAPPCLHVSLVGWKPFCIALSEDTLHLCKCLCANHTMK